VSITLVDSSVLLDVMTEDARWGEWSVRALERCANEGALAINTVIYAEVSIRFDRIEELDAALPEREYQRLPFPWEAGFLAGKSFLRYRRRGGARSAPLPDFFIGAHAAISGLRLLTRDAARIRSYFPRVAVISP
jgi:hypothetical protein